ncbi:GFA family protein [Pseudomonas sp. MBLB4136]|uniref:GFA family protein n=1 Tax=Pseudomonas sp. MBLB4136 TaxID=3451558 RepID=UPI003F74BCEB
MAIRGSCLCGSVRYEISGDFALAGHCHCGNCRKANGAAYVSWGLIDPEQFRWTAGQEHIAQYESSPGTHRCFCRQCGSSLASSHAGRVAEVVLGSVDGDPGTRPLEHIFVNSKAVWHEITDDLPQHDEWPPGMGA